MTKAQHTPAPWECDTGGQPIIVNGPEDDQGHNVICTIEDSECQHGEYQYPPEIAAANAHFIAAAPELLAALNTVSNWLACHPIATADDMAQSFPDMLQLIDAAIAKATEAA